MAKKLSYYDALRKDLGGLVEQLQISNLHRTALKNRWLDQVVWADKKADQSRRWHYRLRLTTIIGGVILPALVGINFQVGKANPVLRTWFPYFPFVLSQVIAVSAALEEFCRFGDRWRDYRKMSENLKAEGWQYLQSSGAYSNHNSHQEGYALFASRVESIIKDDVQNYIAELVKQQAKQEQEVAQTLDGAKAVTSDRTLFTQPGSAQPGYAQTPSQLSYSPMSNYAPLPGYAEMATVPSAIASPVALMSSPEAIARSMATLKTRQDTQFKLSTQDSQSLPDSQKVSVSGGSALGVLAYVPVENQHIRVTFAQAIGAENRNTWFVYAPHVELSAANGQPLNPFAPTAGTGQVSYAQSTVPTPGEIRLPVPYFSQRDNMEEPYRTCNTSSCAMAAKFLGANISGDDQYYPYVIKYGDTTDHNAQTQALAELGIKSTWHTNLDFADLDQSLANGLPAVIGILHRGSLDSPTGGHMIVAIGRTANGDYIINDPFGDLMDDYASENGGALVYSRAVLARRWTPDGSGSGWGRLFHGNRSPVVPAQPAQAQIPTLQISGGQTPTVFQNQFIANGGGTAIAMTAAIALSSTYAKDDPSLRSHLTEAMKYKALIEAAIAGCGWLSPSIIAGIGSRESGWGLLLNPPGPSGTGDSGHGRGLMQIDDEGHPDFVSTGKWADPAASLRYAVDTILKPYYDYLADKTSLKGLELLRAAIAAYNAGPGNITAALRDGLDADHYTTGGDYGKDVLSRAGFFQLNGWT